ncbi:RNA-dependent RNA polymerase family protein [Gorillibacterium timonense]|uniref:hypothetical protein n=1 Tax=Gorillibacterium timonense TaxID=1689269 RepID=UPI00071C513F|nr:hypothetical protein [Gorillibacterium timonense]
MIDELLKYYKSNLSTYSLVFKYMPFLNAMVSFLFVLLIISGYILIIILPLSFAAPSYVKGSAIFFGGILILSILVISFFNTKAKRILNNHYSIQVKKGGWRTEQFEDMQRKFLSEYLKSKGLYSEEKLNLLIKILEKEIVRSKPPTFLAPGAFLALFIPVWSQYAVFFFKAFDSTKFNESTSVFVTFTVALFISVCIGTFKAMFSLVEDFFMIEINIKKRFLEKVEDALLFYNDTCVDLEYVLNRSN